MPLTPKLILVVSTLLNLCQGQQEPFFSNNSGEQVEGKDGRWNLDVPPSVNATGNLIFETASSLLQQWPNTRYRNGHNLVPGRVPPGTLLYHGRQNSVFPTVPEWTATDPEHALMFCRSDGGKGCWFLTLVTTRSLNVLYFDGSSAAKMAFGSMDSQDIIAWGKIIPDKAFSERQRLDNLCAWGEKFNIDGFVRMEMDFEMMLCNFAAGVEIESFVNIEGGHAGRPGGPPRPRPSGVPPTPPPGESYRLGQQLEGNPLLRTDAEVLRAGAHHNAYPGESRIKLDLSRLISFYDTDLVPSLAVERFNATSKETIRRLDHRIQGISDSDVQQVMKRLEAAFVSPVKGSGVDWFTLFRVVKDRYADRLEAVAEILNDTYSREQGAHNVMSQLTGLIQPYILYTLNTMSHVTYAANSSTSWTAPAYRLCSVSYTRHIRSFPSINSRLTQSEWLLLNATEQVTKEICRTISNMWAKGVAIGLIDDVDVDWQLAGNNHRSLSGSVDKGELDSVLEYWKVEIKRLMKWLDWSLWLKCKPACGFGEICYLPTWPFFNRGLPGRRPGFDPPPLSRHFSPSEAPSRSGPTQPPDGRWPPMEETPEIKNPQPMCRRVIAPFDEDQ